MCEVFKTHVTAGFSSTWEDLEPERLCVTERGDVDGAVAHIDSDQLLLLLLLLNTVRHHVCSRRNVL